MLDAEQQLIRKAQRGEAESFGALYDHYLPKIYRYILAKVNHRQVCEDIAHEVFLRAWKNIGGFKERGFPFSSWLYRIARNQVIDYYRLQKNTASLDHINPDLIRFADSTEATADVRIAWEKVYGVLRHLTEDEQDVIVMRFVNDLTPKEIAEVVGKSEGAIRVIQHRAIQTLKELTKEA